MVRVDATRPSDPNRQHLSGGDGRALNQPAPT